MENKLSYLSVPLLEDVLKLKMYGDLQGAEKLIRHWLKREFLPAALRQRLLLEMDILRIVGLDQYPYTYDVASQMMAEAFSDYQEDELQTLKDQGAVDWLYLEGQVYFQKRFLANLVKTKKSYQARLLVNREDEQEALRQKELRENIQQMKTKGHRQVGIQLKASLQVKKEHERVGEKVKVYLPLPKDCQQVSEIEILATTPAATVIAPANQGQRTVCFETVLEPDQVFSVEYRYLNRVDYVELDAALAQKEQPTFELQEQLPHIRFTPYLKALLAEIIGLERNPVKKAWLIYQFVTTQFKYSFVREYFTIENISEYAAVNLKGDCGVQAILFITLCRLAGIPAKWQSGLYVSQYDTGCHDWAQFYIAPYGWVFADLSFGGSAYRQGDLERWSYYFGNLDVFRMPANSEIQTDFYLAKAGLRADPIDNQRGEFEYADEGLPYTFLDVKQELILMEEVVQEGKE